VRALIAAFAALAVGFAAGPTLAQEGATSADELLAEGWRLYSEDLEFEQAAEAFAQAVDTPGATEAQQLEALEYLAACRYALEDHEGARDAIQRLLEIDRQGSLHDPSHPPDLLAIVEQVREELPPEAPLPPDDPPDLPPDDPDEGPPTFGSEGTDPDTSTMLEDHYPDRPERPWYTTWWFWTVVGAVVVAGVTTAIVLSVPAGEAEPPSGNLDPGVVQLPCSGIRF
jgi:tetratricopeptide (TPR) repeat protein